MPLYRVMRAISRGFPVAVTWVYIGAFLVALAMMFVFPPATLFLLALGLVGLAVIIPVGKLLRAMQYRAARTALTGGDCPMCGEHAEAPPAAAATWRCAACSAQFEPSGVELTPAGDAAAEGA